MGFLPSPGGRWASVALLLAQAGCALLRTEEGPATADLLDDLSTRPPVDARAADRPPDLAEPVDLAALDLAVEPPDLVEAPDGAGEPPPDLSAPDLGSLDDLLDAGAPDHAAYDLVAPVDASSPPDLRPALPECKAQRVVHIVAGNGGFAWFTLVWPLPAVITGFKGGYAYDDPARAKSLGSVDHPLYARRVGARALWEGVGTRPQVSAFVAGTNLAHNLFPTTTRLGNGTDVVAAGAAAQKALAPWLPVIAFRRSMKSAVYGPANGAPAAAFVDDVDGAIAAMKALGPLPPGTEMQLRPDPAKLMTWHDPGAGPGVAGLASLLLFAANAFRLEMAATVVIPAFADDPHGAFTSLATVTAVADGLAKVLDAFHAELQKHQERRCGHLGQPLSLADNVVLVVSGDTPKNSFNTLGWPDGTVHNANWIFVRSNGYLTPGWFGQVLPGGRTNFDPRTGLLSAPAAVEPATSAALAGLLHAIARGDAAVVKAVTADAYQGVLAPVPP